MTSEPMLPEYLHKDELQYELAARGISTERLNVAALRSLLRTSRDVEENTELLSSMKCLKDPAGTISLYREKFLQIRELVDNTDSSRIALDFPRYLHRLVHLGTRLRHFLQFGGAAPEFEASAQTLREQLDGLLADINTSLLRDERVAPAPGPSGSTNSPQGDQGRLKATFHLPGGVDEEPLNPTSSLVDGVSQGHGQPALSNLLASGGPFCPPGMVNPTFVFAKLPNPVQRMFEGLSPTDGLHLGNLIKFLRVLVRIRESLVVFQVPPGHVLQVFFTFTKGALASKTIEAIRRGDTLHAYHESILSFFIPRRSMLPLLNSEYLRAQRAKEPLSMYITDIKEMAAVLQQDANEAVVVRNILDGLHSQERNRLVFCNTPTTYAELDKMCIYAHNILHNDQSHTSQTGIASNSTPSSDRDVSAAPVSARSRPVCYRCNKPGHTRKDCYVRLHTSATERSRPQPNSR